MMQGWNFEVDRRALAHTRIEPFAVPDVAALAAGEVLLEIERFSLTANNITYAVVGDRLGYWRFFPAEGDWGRIPVWGFARVMASRADDVAVGLRLYGYWPMATHLVTRLRASGRGYQDASDHRAGLPQAYNRYEEAPITPYDDQLALLRPLFTTSFLLDDELSETAPEAVVVLSSASSRTAIGLAWLLARRGAPAIGLTSPANRAFVDSLALYRAVMLYGDLGGLPRGAPTVFVDMAGNAAARADVHARLGDDLVRSVIVGTTHHEARGGGGAALPGPAPGFFFAPDRLAKRREDWGGGELNRRIDEALQAFIADSDWLHVQRMAGPEALSDAYAAVREGRAPPSAGIVVMPTPPT